MPTEVVSLIDELARGIDAIPTVVIAITLLGGPTAALIVYRLLGYRMAAAARRMQAANMLEAVPLWVCAECRSVNAIRVDSCYRCGTARAPDEEVEVIVDHPTTAPAFFEVPAGSPFAALSDATNRAIHDGPGIPVMDTPAPVAEAPIAPGLPMAPLPPPTPEPPIAPAPAPLPVSVPQTTVAHDPVPVGPGTTDEIEVPLWPTRSRSDASRSGWATSEVAESTTAKG
jgi:hypothetical protein